MYKSSFVLAVIIISSAVTVASIVLKRASSPNITVLQIDGHEYVSYYGRSIVHHEGCICKESK